MRLIYEVVSTAGKVRLENQDNFYLNGKTKRMSDAECRMSGTSEKDCTAFAVCDGMGGEDSGEVAAAIAVRALQSYVSEKREINWNECICEANRKVCEYQEEYEISLGTTFAGICFSDLGVTAANVGDSRIYRIHRGEIIQLSKDHSEYQIMVDAGIQADDRTMRRAKSHLTQFLGLPDDKIGLEPHVVNIDDEISGDYYLLCSDGLWGVLPDERLLEIVQRHRMELDSICELLVKAAEKQGSRDNITALLIYVSKAGELHREADDNGGIQMNQKEKNISGLDEPGLEKDLSGIRKIINFFCRRR